MKTRKWYSAKVKPDRHFGIIVMTDMGYVFEAIYTDDTFAISYIEDGKVYFKEVEISTIVKWMKY